MPQWTSSERRGGSCCHLARPRRARISAGLRLAAAAAATLLACWFLASRKVTALVGAYGRRYHSYQDLGGYGYDSKASGAQGSTLMPPLAWLYQDWEGAAAACPALLGIAAAALGGFVLQHCFGRCLPCQRLAVFYPPTLKAGEAWRLLSHAVLHSDLGHLAVNLLHLLNTLDLEGVVAGTGYPACYALGTQQTARLAATATAYAALVASVPYFGAMFEGASALCFGLDGALLGAVGLLLGAGREPALQGFLQVRGWYAAVHMGIDILRGCSSPGGTVGNFAHLAGFVGGLCYILAFLPALGGRPVPTIPCLARGPSGGWEEVECLAFFTPHYSAPVSQVQSAAKAVLVLGAATGLMNALLLRRAHASADGYSVLVKPPSGRAGGGRQLGGGGGAEDMEAALAASLQTLAEEERRRRLPVQ